MGGRKISLPDQSDIDRMKLAHARLLISRFSIDEIRKKGLANLYRWESNGVWSASYDEWRSILTNASDIEVMETIVGQNQRSNRLRQSPPYVGMLDKKEVEALKRCL